MCQVGVKLRFYRMSKDPIIGFRISEADKFLVSVAAERHGKSVSEWIRSLIHEQLHAEFGARAGERSAPGRDDPVRGPTSPHPQPENAP